MYDPLLAAALSSIEREREVARSAGRPIVRRPSRLASAARALRHAITSGTSRPSGRSERTATDVGA